MLYIFSIIFILYAGIVAYFYLAQGKLLYYPFREIESVPTDIDLPYEEITVTTSDRQMLCCWYVPVNGNSRGVVLFPHGNAGNMSTRLDTFRIVHNLGFDMCMFDYRGYGKSGGKPSERGTYADAGAVYSYLLKERNVQEDRITVWGRSLGAAVAAWLGAHYHPRAVILESGFTSVPDVGQQQYPYLPVRYLVKFDYPTIDYVKNIRTAVLVIHSPEDEVVPFSHAEKIAAACGDKSSFLRIRGGHNDGYLLSEDDYVKGVDAFFKKVGM